MCKNYLLFIATSRTITEIYLFGRFDCQKVRVHLLTKIYVNFDL